MQADIRVLGPVEARVDGRRLDLGHPRRQCVLVALAVDAGRPVPPDRLLARVWDGAGTLSSLYGYLSRLRTSFAGTGVHLLREPAGYRLDVDPDAVDLHRFARLTARARRDPDPAAAEALFTEALALWRGDAFGALDSPWLGELRGAAHRDRLTAELDHAELVLARGGHPEVRARLAALADEHPLDERVAELLLRTLYAGGRQAEALDRYERLRVRLADELGADPTPALRRLHHGILTGTLAGSSSTAAAGATGATGMGTADAATGGETAGGAAGGGTAAAVPRQLPAAPRTFGGRVRELAALDAALTGTPVSVSGPGGIGKTWLALRWAYDHLDRFPDGQLYVNLRGFEPDGDPVPPADALGTLLESLGVEPAALPAGVDARSCLLRSLLAGRRLLVLLDNARDTGQLVPLLPGSPTCVVLATSRAELPGLVGAHGARPLTLDVLSDAESRQVLTGHLGADRVAADPPAVDALVAGCSGLPLALGITAARAAIRPDLPLGPLAAELGDSAGRLDALDGGEPAASLRAALTCSLRALPAGAAELFRLLGLAAGPDVGLPAVASLAGLPVAAARARLRALTAAHLVQEHRPGRYRMHDLVRLYAAEQPTDPAAVRRLHDHYLRTGRVAALLFYPEREAVEPPPPVPRVTPQPLPDRAAALNWYAAERQVLLATVDQAVAAGYDAHAWQLVWTLTSYLELRSRWADLIAAQTTALAATRRLGDRPAEALVRRRLATALIKAGRYAEGDEQLRHALDLFGRLGDATGQAHTHLSRALLLARRDQHHAAIEQTRRALDLYIAAGKRTGQADALNALGWLHANLGDHRAAVRHCERAVALHREIGYRHGEANTWDSLGSAHHHLGDLDRATECFDRALDLYRERGDRSHEGETLRRLGETHLAAARPAAALATWEAAVDIFTELGHPAAAEARDRLAALAPA